MKKITLISAITALFLVSLVFLLCTNEHLTSTDVVNEKVITVYLADGLTPAPNTTVRFYAVGDTSKLYKYQTVTNEKGQYFLEGVKDLNGVYNVWDQLNDTLMAYQDSAFITQNSYNVKDDTLQITGALTGIVGLQPNHDPRTVTVQVLGTHKFSNVDSSAHFTLCGMAAGEYSLKISTTVSQYTSIYSDIRIRSDITDTVKDTLKLIYTGIPAVTGMKVSYDTLNGVVTLSWNRVQYQNLQDYLVYRAYKDSVQWPVAPFKSTENTGWIDSIFKKSITTGPFSFSDTNNYHFKYRVCVRNNSNQIGLPYEYVDIKTPSPTLVRTFFSWKYLNTIGDSASINDTVSIIVNYRNATRKNIKFSWYVGSKDSLFATVNDSSLTGSDTINYVWPKVSTPKIYVSMIDQGNTTWWDSTVLKIVQDVPVANAGKDTTVIINSPVTLTGTYTQQFGTIVIYKWDFNGDGIYDDSSASTSFLSHTYTHETAYNEKFYVRDDDGNEATDVRVVTVQNNAPIITSIRPDTNISIKDSITLRATVVDNDGTIKEYAWDVEGDGTFDYTSPSQPNTGYRYNIAGTYKEIIRVTDDDDKVTKDTAVVTVLQDVPVADAGKDTTVSINDLIRLHGSAKDSFGVIIKWEWDFGNTGTFIHTSTSDTIITAASSENLNYQCVLRVTDDDGNEAKDTIKISFLLDVPVVDAGIDTTVNINSPVTLKGIATQQFGTIVIYKWDFSGDGIYDDSSSSTSSLSHSYTHEAFYNAKFYVRDDDGNEATDIRKVTVLKGVPVITSIRPDTTISIKDSIALRATAVDSDGTIKEYAWDANGDGVCEYNNATQPNTGYRYNIAGIYNAIIQVTDDVNQVTKDTALVTVLQDIPVVNAGKDTVVSINDLIRLHGSANDGLGVIIKWEWDIGNTGTFKQTSTYDTTITAPASENLEYKCVLSVMDDDGNMAKDTVKITVLQDVPVVNAENDTVVFMNDPIHLRGSAKDSFGIIVKWEWDIGNTGTFIQTSTLDTDITAPSTELANMQCVLAVTDDDGNTAKDTVRIGTFGSVTDIDGNVYKTVKIGNQVWMAENLKTTRYNNGTAIPLITDLNVWYKGLVGAYRWPNNDSANMKTFGAIYNFYGVPTIKGWHLPNNEEWDILQNYLIDNGYNWDGTTTGNKIAKSLSANSYWKASTNSGAIGNDPTKNNRSGFSALPAGSESGAFGLAGYWWANSLGTMEGIYLRDLSFDKVYINAYDLSYRHGYSVRLIKD